MYPCDIKNAEMDANGQVLAQHDGGTTPTRYFYLHDRLGSVRILINTSGNVENYYTYDPFGELLEFTDPEPVSNPFEFTGQWFDAEINQYHLRARMYDPVISRFTSRDPVSGNFENPLSLHKYLYCQNDPANWVDPSGEWAIMLGNSISLVPGVGNITVGWGTYFIFGEDIYFGNYKFVATGPALGLGMSANVDICISEKARYEEDLAGAFQGFGFSVSVAPYVSVGYEKTVGGGDYPIDFYNVSYGLSVSPPWIPWEVHWGYGGEMVVGSWGDFSKTRRTSRYETNEPGYSLVLY